MLTMRSGVLPLALSLLLASAECSTRFESNTSGKDHDDDDEQPEQLARVVRVRSAEFGAGECPSGIELELWPPNHKVVEIDLEELLGGGVTGIEITAITQDEPVDERGDGNTECDGTGLGTSAARIRSERSGRGNGRVYEITYSAFAGACSGFVLVVVPHDQRGEPAVDDGQEHDSTEGCP